MTVIETVLAELGTNTARQVDLENAALPDANNVKADIDLMISGSNRKGVTHLR
jgi:hypothetical protein